MNFLAENESLDRFYCTECQLGKLFFRFVMKKRQWNDFNIFFAFSSIKIMKLRKYRVNVVDKVGSCGCGKSCVIFM